MLKKLASMTSFHSELSISELAKLAGGLRDDAMLGLSSHSMAREATLGVLKALSALISGISDGLGSHKTRTYS